MSSNAPVNASTPRTPSHSGRWAALRAAPEAGFSIVEVMVAALVLVVGLLGVVTMTIRSSEATAASHARQSATNLTRELVEAASSLPYTSVEPATVGAALRAKSRLAPPAGSSGWKLSRGGVTYDVSATVCYVDDPVDGSGTAGADACPGAGGGTADSQPVDYKRVSVTVGWTQNGAARSVRQYALVSPRGNADVPKVTNLASAQSLTVTSAAVTSLHFTATTSAVPTGVAWTVEGGVRGTATGSGTSWDFTWDISGLPDGTYSVGAQAYNGAGTYGVAKSLPVRINRGAPAAPTNFVAGYNGVADTVNAEWLAPVDRDVIGYTVYRQQTAPVTGPITKVTCVGESTYVTTKTSCADAAPLALPTPTPIAFRAAKSNNNNTDMQLNLPLPNSVAGDVLVATLAASGSGAITAPAGWTLIGDTVANGVRHASYYHVAGATEPGSVAWAFATSRDAVGGVSSYSGVDTVGPVDGWTVADGTSATASAPAVATTTRGAAVLSTYTFVRSTSIGNPTVTADSTTTKRWDQSKSFYTAGSADAALVQAGTTQPKPATLSTTSTGWLAETIALRNARPNGTVAARYWVVALDNDTADNPREGTASSTVDAYAVNRPPAPITSAVTCTKKADGSSQLGWTQPAQPGDVDSGDNIAFTRVYRDGARFDRTTIGTDNTWNDGQPGGTHTYRLRNVDTHLAESAASASVTC